MRAGQLAGVKRMLQTNAEHLEALLAQIAVEVVHDVAGLRQLAQLMFYGDFPSACRAHAYATSGFANGSTSCDRELRIVQKPPKQRMRVEQ